VQQARALLYLLLLIFGCIQTQAQEKDFLGRVIDNIFNDTSSTEKPKFIAYPTLAYAPETRWEIGMSALYVYYARQDINNRLSEINAFTFFTLEKQYGLWFDHALYSHRSEWFFLGRARFQRFPLLYYGQGPTVTGEELAQINAGSINIRERILRKVKGHFYVGLETDFQKLSNINFEVLSASPFERPAGLEPYQNLGLGLGLVFDNRHNVLNVREGLFGETGFLRYARALGSDIPFTRYFLDMRGFLPVTPSQVWASQFYFSHVEGSSPFNQLSLMGGENLMRGYYLGRYRDQTLIAAQTEYRFLPFPFSRRWGAAAFLSAGTIGHSPKDINLNLLKVAGGAGVRFLIFPGKDIFTRLDVAFSEDGPAYYLFIGEAF